MMGRGADGGCVPDGNPCPIQKTKNCPHTPFPKGSYALNYSAEEQFIATNAHDRMGMDILAQAMKALAVKHPFDADDGSVVASDGSGASQFLLGGGDGRRKHRKGQGRGQEGYSGAKFGGSKKSRDGKTSKLWAEMEEYFREVHAEDLEVLLPKTQINVTDWMAVYDPCLLLPRIRGTDKDETNALQNMNYATFETLFKEEASKAELKDGKDSKHPALGQALEDCVRENAGEGDLSLGADSKGTELSSNKQEMDSELRIIMGEASEQGSGSILNKQVLSSDAPLTERVPLKQELISETDLSATASSPMEVSNTNLAEKENTLQESCGGNPKPEMNSGTAHGDLESVPVLETYSCTKSEAACDLNQESSSTAKLPTQKHESSSGSKLAALSLSPKQGSGSRANFRVVEESNSIPNITSSSNQEQCSGAKRKLLAASFCSKKRKLSMCAAEVITTVISPPENGDEELCDVCYSGDSDERNQILFCDACDVAVHQECYGVQKIPDGQWLCSRCSYRSRPRSMHINSVRTGNGSVSHKWNNGGVDSDSHPCILCPRSSGALKPVARSVEDRDNNGCLHFAHLFCCQWVPETYIENTETMEPIKNVEGISEARWKLICSLCKEKHGACIKCSHGNCATAFHPRCARELKFWMGISNKDGSDVIDLWAFCSKHSLPQVGRASLSRNGSADGPSEVEVMLSGEKDTSNCSEEICSGQEGQSPLIASRCHNKHAQKLLKDVSKKVMADQGNLGTSQGIETKISDIYSAVEPSYAVTELVLGNADNFLCENRGQLKTSLLLHDINIAAHSTAVSDSGNQEVSASSSETRENTMNVEVDNNYIEKLRKESKKQAGSEMTNLMYQRTSLPTKMEDVPAGIGDSAVEKNSNSKHASLKIQAELSDCKELAQLRNNATMEVNNAGLNFEGGQAENYCVDVSTNAGINFRYVKKSPDNYVHPHIQRKLLEFEHCLGLREGDQRMGHDDQLESEAGAAENKCYHGTQNTAQEMDCTSSMPNNASISKESQWKQLIEARNKGVLNLAPESELESEILLLQSSLLDYACINHKHCEDLIFKVITNLSKDQQTQRKQKEDKLFVNEYLSRAREVKKQGRKERRHKEAQAILAAATAAAAASPRIGSSRKDGSGDAVEEHGLRQVSFPNRPLQPNECTIRPGYFGIFSTTQPMKISQQKYVKGNIAAGHPGSSSQTMLRAKETLSRPIVAKISSEKQLDAYQVPAGSLQDESLLCDICRLQELTRANKIFTCSHCKVAVHQDCYGLSRFHSAGWYCQPCEELLYQGMRLPSIVNRGRPGYGVECALCDGLSGAFKRTTDGKWVHVFCAEWILENTFRRGQIEPIVGLELLSRERYMVVCSICHRNQGFCLKCNFGHCQSAFHPLCARDSGFYMSASTHSGRIQHKAYCEKHSSEKKLKDGLRRYGGAEELKIIKQIRVGLERLRLICERTVRREKLKRELLHCSHNILASKRDCVAFSAVFHSSFLPPDVTSHPEITQGSIVSSLCGVAAESKGLKDYSTEKHRLDGYAIDTASGQPRDVFPGQSEFNHPMFIMDDFLRGRTSADSSAVVGESGRSRKPLTYTTDSGTSDDRDDANRRPKKSRKLTETLQREMVMTPMEASMQNKRLPKGYAYVPFFDLQNVGRQD